MKSHIDKLLDDLCNVNYECGLHPDESKIMERDAVIKYIYSEINRIAECPIVKAMKELTSESEAFYRRYVCVKYEGKLMYFEKSINEYVILLENSRHMLYRGENLNEAMNVLKNGKLSDKNIS